MTPVIQMTSATRTAETRRRGDAEVGNAKNEPLRLGVSVVRDRLNRENHKNPDPSRYANPVMYGSRAATARTSS
jgi:hypothetical protein